MIGRAVGIIIERYRVDDDTAFNFLVRVSSQTQTKLRELAADIVADAVSRARDLPGSGNTPSGAGG